MCSVVNSDIKHTYNDIKHMFSDIKHTVMISNTCINDIKHTSNDIKHTCHLVNVVIDGIDNGPDGPQNVKHPDVVMISKTGTMDIRLLTQWACW